MAHVLYLDDDPTQLVLLSRWLEALGHSVAGFTNAEQALAAYKANRGAFEFVLTDMSMPLLSGLEFGQQILAIEPGALVIIATGCEDPNWADLARSSGMQVVEKPTSVNEMEETLRRALLARHRP